MSEQKPLEFEIKIKVDASMTFDDPPASPDEETRRAEAERHLKDLVDRMASTRWLPELSQVMINAYEAHGVSMHGHRIEVDRSEYLSAPIGIA